MVNYICPKCNKIFNKKSHYINHTENKKNPCDKTDFLIPPKISFFSLDIKKDEEKKNNNELNVCSYCDKKFTRQDNLFRHLNQYCKTKANYDELEKLKEEMKMLVYKCQNLLCEQKINNNINSNNNINNNQINNGIINNIKIVQFGKEDIDKMDLIEAVKTYSSSTGGNIASNMLVYLNLNKKHPENNNICITDLSREIVKIHNGNKFIYKKYKNVKNEILTKVIQNTRKIINKFQIDSEHKMTTHIKDKIRINDVSLKLIEGYSGEDIVRDEIKKQNNYNSDDSDNDNNYIERDFTFNERMRIKLLDDKREGLQIKTFENIKDELYNHREIINNY